MTLTSRRKRESPLYRVTDANGELTDACKEVIDLVVTYDAVLATGHVSKDEILAAYLTFAPYGGNLEGVRAFIEKRPPSWR